MGQGKGGGGGVRCPHRTTNTASPSPAGILARDATEMALLPSETQVGTTMEMPLASSRGCGCGPFYTVMMTDRRMAVRYKEQFCCFNDGYETSVRFWCVTASRYAMVQCCPQLARAHRA